MRLKVDSESGERTCYKILAGQSGIAASRVLEIEDVAISAFAVFFSQSLNGTIFLLCTAQNVVINQAVKNLVENLSNIPCVRGLVIEGVGATDLRKLIAVDEWGYFLFQYMLRS